MKIITIVTAGFHLCGVIAFMKRYYMPMILKGIREGIPWEYCGGRCVKKIQDFIKHSFGPKGDQEQQEMDVETHHPASISKGSLKR